jgi:hypothetical protein
MMSSRVFAVWVTGAEDGLDHAVCDDAMVAGIDEGNGRFRALCGVVVPAAPMIEPPGRRCRRCSEMLYTPPQSQESPERRGCHTKRARHRLSGRSVARAKPGIIGR